MRWRKCCGRKYEGLTLHDVVGQIYFGNRPLSHPTVGKASIFWMTVVILWNGISRGGLA